MKYVWQEEIEHLKQQLKDLKSDFKIIGCWKCKIAGQIDKYGFCIRGGVYQ